MNQPEFALTEDDIYLLVKFIAHSAESDCDCFSTEQLLQAGELLEKFSHIGGVETQEEIENRIREFGEP